MANKCQILMVEDDMGIGNFINTILLSNGYGVLRAKNGETALMMVSSLAPMSSFSTWVCPIWTGLDVCETGPGLVPHPDHCGFGRSNEKDKVTALDLGADDYITKPFGSAELLARIRTALRHAAGSDGTTEMPLTGVFHTGGLTIDYDKRHVYVDGVDVHVTQNEYKIVSLLSRYAGRVLTYDHIIRSVWGPNSGGDNQILRVNMANIRRKIEKNPGDPAYIFTEIGVGYRMAEGD